MIQTDNTLREFLNKKTLLDHRLNNEILKDGVAHIPCYVENMEDIISKYSVKNCESLESAFTDYIKGFIECIPAKHPIVLEIYGPKFSEDEKRIITETIVADGDYELGRVEQENRHHRTVFWQMVAGTLVTGIVLGMIGKYLGDIPHEFFFVLFWLFADSCVRYLFVERGDHKIKKIVAGRLASMKVEFIENDK